MNIISKNGLILSTAVLFLTGVASANKIHIADDSSTTRNLVNGATYTASGKMDIKTAMMLKNLLKNPHLKVHVNVGKKSRQGSATYTAHGKTDRKTAMMLVNLLRNPHLTARAQFHKPAKHHQTKVAINYTIKGSTDRKTVMKLKHLLQNSKNIQITAQVNSNKYPQQKYTGTFNTAPMRQDFTKFVPAYTPFYYNGKPPVYIQGNTMWYPVPVSTQTQMPVKKKIMIAKN